MITAIAYSLLIIASLAFTTAQDLKGTCTKPLRKLSQLKKSGRTGARLILYP